MSLPQMAAYQLFPPYKKGNDEKKNPKPTLSSSWTSLFANTISSSLYLEPQHKWCVTTGSDHVDSAFT